MKLAVKQGGEKLKGNNILEPVALMFLKGEENERDKMIQIRKLEEAVLGKGLGLCVCIPVDIGIDLRRSSVPSRCLRTDSWLVWGKEVTVLVRIGYTMLQRQTIPKS